jgi:acetyltransferase-like isoleucine patch superfamily enzyme
MKKSQILLYENYSYLNHWFNLLHNFLPPFLRRLIFRITFKSLGNGVMIDYGTYFRYPKKIHIANGVEINRGCQFYPSFKFKNSIIKIGENVLIAPNVVFFGAGHSSVELTDVSDDIFIGKNSYIGGNSIIRYGTRIGVNCVIATGSIVVSNIPDYSLAAGNPAKVIKYLGE